MLEGEQLRRNSILSEIMREQKLQQEIEKHDIIWNWVKGHSDNEGNNIADRLAVEAREKARRKQ